MKKFVLLDGQFVSSESIRPETTRYIGTRRPPTNPMDEIYTYVLCTCGQILQNRGEFTTHYNKGCLDILCFESIAPAETPQQPRQDTTIKVGTLGRFHRPNNNPFLLGDFVLCRVLALLPEGQLSVELRDRAKEIIAAGEFTPLYFPPDLFYTD